MDVGKETPDGLSIANGRTASFVSFIHVEGERNVPGGITLSGFQVDTVGGRRFECDQEVKGHLRQHTHEAHIHVTLGKP